MICSCKSADISTVSENFDDYAEVFYNSRITDNAEKSLMACVGVDKKSSYEIAVSVECASERVVFCADWRPLVGFVVAEVEGVGEGDCSVFKTVSCVYAVAEFAQLGGGGYSDVGCVPVDLGVAAQIVRATD